MVIMDIPALRHIIVFTQAESGIGLERHSFHGYAASMNGTLSIYKYYEDIDRRHKEIFEAKDWKYYIILE